jgi:AAA+ superfamily predicted ATPase
LNRLDLLLRLHLAGEPPEDEVNRFKGIFLQRKEILALLNPNTPQITPDHQALRDELSRLDQAIAERVALSHRQGVYLPLAHLTELFQLSPLQRLVVLICLAPELDRNYEKIYAYLQDDLTRKRPGVDLIFRLLLASGEEKLAARREFDPETPLVRFLINVMDDSGDISPLLARTLKLDDRIADFLTGTGRPDPRLDAVADLSHPGAESGEPQTGIPVRIGQYLNNYRLQQKEAPDQPHPVFYFYGPEGAGKLGQAQASCWRLGISLLTVDLAKLAALEMPFREAIRLLVREALLQNAALCLEKIEALAEAGEKRLDEAGLLHELFRDFTPLVFILGEGPWKPADLSEQYAVIEVEFTTPDEQERHALWESLGRDYHLALEVDLVSLAGKFRFTPGRIGAALRMAGQTADWKTPGAGRIEAADLYRACYRLSNQKLSALAQKITARYTWDALVLPGDQLEQLREICDQVKYKHQVFGEWRFGRKLSLGKGLNVMFSGPPGCGKTMAAEVIAGALSLELYKIDLSRVVSKYIGETEKNLGRIFAEAETSNAILFFDEADALFGKRSEVKDAHDRYANIETGYLLQKMEEYEGLVILATNLSQNMDQAFLRRMQFSVEFFFPEKTERAEIWRKIFPAEAPLAEIDFEFLADKLKIAGGNIKNIALRAAFYAAAESQAIGMKQIMRAVRREYQKMGKMFLPNDFEPYHQI